MFWGNVAGLHAVCDQGSGLALPRNVGVELKGSWHQDRPRWGSYQSPSSSLLPPLSFSLISHLVWVRAWSLFPLVESLGLWSSQDWVGVGIWDQQRGNNFEDVKAELGIQQTICFLLRRSLRKEDIMSLDPGNKI